MRITNNLKLAILQHAHKMRVSTGYHQTKKRWLQIRMFQIVGGDMSLNMMNAD